MEAVVSHHKKTCCLARRRDVRGSGLWAQRGRHDLSTGRKSIDQSAPQCGAGVALPLGQGLVHKFMDRPNQRAHNFHRIVLFGQRAKVRQVIGRVVDAADKRTRTIDHHDFAVHAPKQIGTPTPQPRARVKHVDPHASVCQRRQEGGRQIG